MDNRAIGVFDSGLGGLTTVRRMHEIMPHETIIYFGDTGRVPYGTRGAETIKKYTRQDVNFLRTHELKAIIIACNTVSAVALDAVQAENRDIPIIDVVSPACEKALSATKNGKIGVAATAATIRSGAYEKTLYKGNENLSLWLKECPLFVPLVENGRVNKGDIVIETVVKEYLSEMKESGIDTLILGCTHYPLLAEVIADFMGNDVTLIDSGAEAANRAKNTLVAAQGTGETRYFVSDDPKSFDNLSSLFLQKTTKNRAELIDISRYE